ncbi:MAG: leucine-rich repeat domain-containing protein [Clostridia bacterium]|nr:leucine-rich repeat domain-containing protein [Clostridia bacterium]
MKRTLRLSSLLLALLLCCAAFLTACTNPDGKDTSTEEPSGSNEPAVPYEIFYESIGGKTCYVSDIRIYAGEKPLTIEIPETAPDGKTVIEYRTEALSFQLIPYLLLAEDFVAHIETPMKEAVDNGDISSSVCGIILGYFNKISLEDAKTERAKAQMLLDYPLVAVTDLYEFDPNAVTPLKHEITDYLKKHAGYSVAQYAADIDHMAQVAKENGIDQILPVYPNDTDRVIEISIPDSMTKICEGAFGGCVNAVELENNVFYVDDWAVDCTGRASVVSLRNGTVGIATAALSNYDNLESVTLPDSLKILGYEAFQGCNWLEEIVIPDGVTEISYRAFYDCSALKRVVIPEGVITIGYQAFSGCSNLAEITFPSSLQNLGGGAFDDCQSIKSVYIPKNVTQIGSNPFDHCKSLESITVDPENTEYYSRNNCLISKKHVVISGCKNSVIPTDESINGIGSSAFSGCTGLTSIVIPEGVTYINTSAFYECTELSSVVIPKSVTSMWATVFGACSSLSAVYYGGTPEEWEKIRISELDDELLSATRYYYSEKQPTEAGNYWRYVDGVPTAW